MRPYLLGITDNFYDYDVPRLKSCAERWQAEIKNYSGEAFVWLVRDCGTFLLGIDKETIKPYDTDFYRAVYDNMTVLREYTIIFNRGEWTIKQNRKKIA